MELDGKEWGRDKGGWSLKQMFVLGLTGVLGGLTQACTGSKQVIRPYSLKLIQLTRINRAFSSNAFTGFTTLPINFYYSLWMRDMGDNGPINQQNGQNWSRALHMRINRRSTGSWSQLTPHFPVFSMNVFSMHKLNITNAERVYQMPAGRTDLLS